MLNGPNWRVIELDIVLLVYSFGKHIHNALHQRHICTRFIIKQIYIHNTLYTESYTVKAQGTYNTWRKLVTHKVSFIHL